MSDLNEKVRVKCEEQIRDMAYGILDAHSHRIPEDEKKLWEELHQKVSELAKFYEARGHSVWKH